MADVIAFVRRNHVRASAAKVKTSGLASLPDRSKTPEKIKKYSAGIRFRNFQLETAEAPTRASEAAASSPPTPSTISSTEFSTPYEYSHGVNMSSGHISEMENPRELGLIHGVQTVGKIAARLRATQAALGKKSAVICRETGIAPNAWSQFRKGKDRIITVEEADKLCDTYRLTLDWIYRGDPYGLPDGLLEKIQQAA